MSNLPLDLQDLQRKALAASKVEIVTTDTGGAFRNPEDAAVWGRFASEIGPATVLELIAEVERQEGVIKIMANHNVELIDEIDALTAQRDEMAEALGECLEAMEIVQSGNYGTCPVVSDPACRNDGPETPCPRCGDLGWFSDDPEYDPEKDGNCINDGASAILRKPISRARSSLNKEKTDG